MARLKLRRPAPVVNPERGLPIGFAMARLKRAFYPHPLFYQGDVRWGLTDRIRDGAIETYDLCRNCEV